MIRCWQAASRTDRHKEGGYSTRREQWWPLCHLEYERNTQCPMAKVLLGSLFTCFRLQAMNASVKEKGNCAPVLGHRKNQSQNTVFLWGERYRPGGNFGRLKFFILSRSNFSLVTTKYRGCRNDSKVCFCSVEKSPNVTIYVIFDHSRFKRVSDP